MVFLVTPFSIAEIIKNCKVRDQVNIGMRKNYEKLVLYEFGSGRGGVRLSIVVMQDPIIVQMRPIATDVIQELAKYELIILADYRLIGG